MWKKSLTVEIFPKPDDKYEDYVYEFISDSGKIWLSWSRILQNSRLLGQLWNTIALNFTKIW